MGVAISQTIATAILSGSKKNLCVFTNVRKYFTKTLYLYVCNFSVISNAPTCKAHFAKVLNPWLS